MTQSPQPWPDHISNKEFERHVRRLFEGKTPSESSEMTYVSGPSGAGKTTFGYGLMARLDYQNTVMIDWNENMLVHLDSYKADRANGLPMAEVYNRNVGDCIFLTCLLRDAALGQFDDELRKEYDLDEEKLAILRKYVLPQPYDIIISTVLSGLNNDESTWSISPAFGYRNRTLNLLLADFDDCKERVKLRGGWLQDPEKREAMQWYMGEDTVRKNFECFQENRDKNIQTMAQTGIIHFFGLPPGGTAPIQFATQLATRRFACISNPKLWQHFMGLPSQAAPANRGAEP
jgi:hypothetical protein